MLGENIGCARRAAGLTQEELAGRTHVVRQTISKWEKGLSAPDADQLMELAEALGATTDALLGQEPGAPKNLEELAVQTALLNEQLALQGKRLGHATLVAKCCGGALACVLTIGFAAFWVHALSPKDDYLVSVSYTMDGQEGFVGIWLGPNDPATARGYFFDESLSEYFADEDGFALEGFVRWPGKAQSLQHAVETIIEANGGTVTGISTETIPH